MGCRKQGTLPEPRLHKRGHLRLRVDGQEFVLGKPGSQQADERYKAILAAWGSGGGRLPDDFRIDANQKISKTFKPTKHFPDTNQICVADLLCTAFVDVEEKSWRWYLLRHVAVYLEPYENLLAIETMATTPIQVNRRGKHGLRRTGGRTIILSTGRQKIEVK